LRIEDGDASRLSAFRAEPKRVARERVERFGIFSRRAGRQLHELLADLLADARLGRAEVALGERFDIPRAVRRESLDRYGDLLAPACSGIRQKVRSGVERAPEKQIEHGAARRARDKLLSDDVVISESVFRELVADTHRRALAEQTRSGARRTS